jgi:hypothetical protein
VDVICGPVCCVTGKSAFIWTMQVFRVVALRDDRLVPDRERYVVRWSTRPHAVTAGE